MSRLIVTAIFTALLLRATSCIAAEPAGNPAAPLCGKKTQCDYARAKNSLINIIFTLYFGN